MRLYRIKDEDAIRRMSRALRPLLSAEFLACAAARHACYLRGDIAPAEIAAHDTAAHDVECLRRTVFARPIAAAA